MKASELVERLQEIIAEHGDLPLKGAPEVDELVDEDKSSDFWGAEAYDSNGNQEGLRVEIYLHTESRKERE